MHVCAQTSALEKKKNHCGCASCDNEDSAVWFRRGALMREVGSRIRWWFLQLNQAPWFLDITRVWFIHQQYVYLFIFLSRVVHSQHHTGKIICFLLFLMLGESKTNLLLLSSIFSHPGGNLVGCLAWLYLVVRPGNGWRWQTCLPVYLHNSQLVPRFLHLCPAPGPAPWGKVCVRACVCVCVFVSLHVYAYSCTHTHTHTHTHTRTHTNFQIEIGPFLFPRQNSPHSTTPLPNMKLISLSLSLSLSLHSFTKKSNRPSPSDEARRRWAWACHDHRGAEQAHCQRRATPSWAVWAAP